VSKYYRNIWYNDKTWNYLIKRNFGVIYENQDAIMVYKNYGLKIN